jgi:hypothetical protein
VLKIYLGTRLNYPVDGFLEALTRRYANLHPDFGAVGIVGDVHDQTVLFLPIVIDRASQRSGWNCMVCNLHQRFQQLSVNSMD